MSHGLQEVLDRYLVGKIVISAEAIVNTDSKAGIKIKTLDVPTQKVETFNITLIGAKDAHSKLDRIKEILDE